jgi:hypothetical protein
LSKHPWSLSGGGAVELLQRVGASQRHLSGVASEVGIAAVIGEEEAFDLRPNSQEPSIDFVIGEAIRDYMLEVTPRFWPYDSDLRVTERARTSRWMWPYRRLVAGYLMFGKTRAERGLEWLEYGMLAKSKLRVPMSIAFAFVATHNHFVLDRGGKVFKQSAPVIKLPEGATEDDHLALLGVLNSSTACFWLKQNSHPKSGSGIGRGIQDEDWENRYEFTGTTLQDFPLPPTLPLERGRLLDSLAQEVVRQAPTAVCAAGVPARAALDAARAEHDRIRARMIAEQEELDWEVYRLYGLVDEDLTYQDDPPGLALGERAFEIALARRVAAGEEETAWFARHGSTAVTDIPSHWPAAYRDLVRRRLDLIGSDRSIGLLEKPEHKRRWSIEAWGKREKAALRDWLLDRLEDTRFWFDAADRPAPHSMAWLADQVARDPDLSSVLGLWAGRPDAPVTATLVELLADQAVPYLAAYRYKPSGLRKREAWEHTWSEQRREDRGEKLAEPIPVPPKYTSADFTRVAYWQHRGKLDVPKERFFLYPAAGRDTDPTPLLGWAGWDHAQQALALNTIIQDRESDGWPDQRLVPLAAGLAELQPWVDQWHAEVDPAYGVSPAGFCGELLTEHAARVGKTLDELKAWRPEPSGRGRRTSTAGGRS